jgi:hypothetical protein
MKTNFVVQSAGMEIKDTDVVAKIKEQWIANGKLVKDIKNLTSYIKPEEKKVYYTINEDFAGCVEI